MRSIAIVTVGRSDYSIYLPVLRRLRSDRDVTLHVVAGGMHLSAQFGATVATIEADGFEVAERVEMLLSSDTPEAIAKSMGLGVIGFAQAYGRLRPDFVVVLGDRFEMHAAALAALPFKIPVAHIHGGEITAGAIDDALRHSITKLSHLHFVSTEEHAQRVRQMGEEAWRVVTTGAPGLDNLREFRSMTIEELTRRYGLPLDRPPILVTFHPVTLEYERTAWQVAQLLKALDAIAEPLVFTSPNADTSGGIVSRLIQDFVRVRPRAMVVDNFGLDGYFSMMTHAAAMVGNSSSGIIEAASFALPVVNIGIRQQGRIRSRNVIDVGYEWSEIVSGIRRALAPEFRATLSSMTNPYGDGQAAGTIVDRLKTTPIDDRLLIKRFADAVPAVVPA